MAACILSTFHGKNRSGPPKPDLEGFGPWYDAGGDPDAHNLPQPYVKMAMQSCAWSVLIQTLMVVAIPLVLGGEPKVSKDGTPEVEGDSMMAKVFTTLRYVAMAGMCSRYFCTRGFAT